MPSATVSCNSSQRKCRHEIPHSVFYTKPLEVIKYIKSNPTLIDSLALDETTRAGIHQNLTALDNQRCGIFDACLEAVYHIAAAVLLENGPMFLNTIDTSQAHDETITQNAMIYLDIIGPIYNLLRDVHRQDFARADTTFVASASAYEM